MLNIEATLLPRSGAHSQSLGTRRDESFSVALEWTHCEMGYSRSCLLFDYSLDIQ